MNARLSACTDYESREWHELVDRMTALNDRLSFEESENHEAEMERTLIGLGFQRSDFTRPTGEFSGGGACA